MRTTVTLDDELMARAEELTGRSDKSGLLRQALEALIAQESGRRLARLGGSDPTAEAAPRRRRRAAS
jgi:Arc/MetJ family transcription regulator